jgi:hypothetical protein
VVLVADDHGTSARFTGQRSLRSDQDDPAEARGTNRRLTTEVGAAQASPGNPPGRSKLDEVRDFIPGLVTTLQKRIDDIATRAKKRPTARTRAETALTEADVEFLRSLYIGIGQGGRVFAPEAAQLMRRYLNPDKSSVEEVDSAIYKESAAVRAELDRQKKEIVHAARTGQLPGNAKAVHAIHAGARKSEACEHPRDVPRPHAARMVLADGERLKKANNRFWVQSYSTRKGNLVTTTFVVTDCYEFEPFRKGFFTDLELFGQRIRLDDGLSEYLTRVGVAKAFTYESTWQDEWTLPSESVGGPQRP